jgi:hypothetical protein
MFIMEVNMRHFVAVFYWLLQLANSSPQPQLLQTCCGVILLRSGGPAAVSQQAARLGVYLISGLLNGRPVYKHERNRGDATLTHYSLIFGLQADRIWPFHHTEQTENKMETTGI